MNIEERLIGPFVQAKYLSESNYRRYTMIINYLYRQHEYYYAPPSMPSEIYDYITGHDPHGVFLDYDEQKVEEDLKQLEEWGNIVSHADSSHVNRIEDFNRRRLRYQCTQVTINIERLLEQLDSKLQQIKGALDSAMVGSISGLILSLQKYETGQSAGKEIRAELHQLWNQIIEQFDKLRQQASDYLGIIHSKKLEEAMQNKEISTFRIKFTEYLTDFIISLQEHVPLIEYTFKEISRTDLIDWVVKQLVVFQQDKPTLEDWSDAELRDIYMLQWNGLAKWFTYDEHGERFVNYLMKQTNETISVFTSYLQQMSEREQQVKSRKHELLHVAALFEQELSLDRCKRSFGAMTNVEKPPHLFSMRDKEVYPEQTIIEHETEFLPLKDVKHAGARKRKVLAAAETSAADERVLIEFNKQKRLEERKLQQFTSQGEVVLEKLAMIDPFVRQAILNWISRATGKDKVRGKTEQGINYWIEKKSDEWIKLRAPDGILHMPDYVFHFEVG